MHRTGAAVLLVWAVVLAATAFVAQNADAAVAGFGLRFEANTNGSILLRGNANLICSPAATGCPAGRDGLGAKLDDNDFTMVAADADHDPATVNDSTATVSLPPGSTVLFAGLYWSANTTAGSGGTAAPSAANKNRVGLRTPAGAGWLPVTATTVYGTGAPYQGFADVTALVAGAGSGVYGVADIQTGTGVDRFAGWALAVAYRNPAEVLRALRVYDGLGTVSSGSGNLDIPVSGFETPHSGTVRAEVGTVAYEGDLGKKGDVLRIDGQLMSDDANPVDNFFNSTVSSGGLPVGGRDPGFVNLLGVDIDQFDATGKLGHAVTSATLTLSTTSDTYYPGVVSFAIDLYAPKLVTTITGTDLNHGDLLPGDILEYRIEVRNDGNDVADGTVLTAPVPTFTTFVPGSARIQGVPVADATTFTLGDIPYQGITYVIFQVRLDAGIPAGYAVTSLANLSYTGHTAGVGVSGLAGAVASVVAPSQADLTAALTVSPGVVQRAALPAPVTYLITVTDNGAGAEPDAQAELTLPAGVTAGTLPPGCTGFGAVVTCALGPLVAGSRATAAIPATVQAAAAARPSASLLVYGTSTEANPADNTASADVVVNLAPRATADPAAAPGVIAVLANDDDPDGPTTALTVTITTPPAHGSAIVLADGTIAYTPAAGWAGDDPFTYAITDASGGSATAVVTVRTPNAPPVAADDAGAVDTGGSVTVPVTANDTDPNGDPLTVTAVVPQNPAAGTVTFTGATITFTPVNSFVGVATFTYTVSDGAASATAQLTVNVANAVPTAADDQATVAYLGAVTIPVLANDQDINGDTLIIDSFVAPTDGTASILGTGIVYQGAPGFSGVVTFSYRIDDQHGGLAAATITVTVADAPPVAVDVAATTPYLIAVTVDPRIGATDPNPGNVLRVIGALTPAHGTVVRNPDGTLTYTPDPGWSGTDSFVVTLGDGQGGTDTGTVIVVVDNAPPVAAPDAVTRPSGVPATIDVLVNDDDPNGDPLTVTIDATPAHGTATVVAGQVRYQPDPGYAGADTLHYTIDDGHLGTSGAAVTITLVNAAPQARPDTASTPTGTPVTIDVTGNDDDPNGDPLTLLGWTAAAHGTVTAGPGATVRYTPAGGFTGTDTFGYTIADAHGVPDTAAVTVVVRNAPPVAEDDTFRVRAQGPTSLPVTANDHDPNTGQALSVLAAGPAGTGTVTVTGPLTVGYTPAPGATADTFGYQLTDDLGGTSSATVTITVDAAPTATDDTAETGAGVPVTIAATANDYDPEGGALTVSWSETPAHGTASLQPDGRLRYVPAAGWVGADTFRYDVRDPIGNTARARVTVLVRGAPVARPDVAAVRAGRQVSVDVLVNDTTAVPGGLTITSVGAPARGSATTAGGTVRYAAPAAWTGQVDFRYEVTDTLGATAESTVTVLVTDVTPFAVPDSRVTAYRKAITIGVLTNDLDDSGSLQVIAVTTPAATTAARAAGPDAGRAAVTDMGQTVTYTPPDGFSGEARFEYTAEDADGHRTSTTVTVTVGPPPAVPDMSASTPTGQPAGIPLPAVDDQGRPVAQRRISQPAHGTARLNPDGSVTYTPDPGFAGEDRFTYEIVDADGNLATGTIVVTVVAPPASPSPSPPASPTSAPSASPSRSRQAPASPRPTLPRSPAPPGIWPELPTTSVPDGPVPALLFATSGLFTLLGGVLYLLGARRPPLTTRHRPGRHRLFRAPR
ncbi:Ig-like domain-containing protein [Actinoplanes palleronii]|uniref:DUF11 domain-containing protein n=1 Tax=Actinoplanes palleronii TaxID=113570 RepID=A0ABQ4BJX3_9ACTN|nr:Ig-like domain-containing protein [Actinoplanes palleronii]GIE70932.1 hypothetical protein Apa02nite_070400 [Actinoplanes palleronii]